MQGQRELVQEKASTFLVSQAFRFWGAAHGGCDLLVEARSDEIRTGMDPAYMVHQMMEHFDHLGSASGRVVSLQPHRPENRPDEWEQRALESFEIGVTEAHEFVDIDGEPFARQIRPIRAKQSCLGCHEKEGYKEGDVRGGISVAIAAEPFYSRARKEVLYNSIAMGILWLIGLVGLVIGASYVRRSVRERDQAEAETKLRARLQQSQKMESLGTFASGVAHEINNPIQIVCHAAELVLDHLESDGPDAKLIDNILVATERVSAIVKNLLSFASRDMGNYSLVKATDIVDSTVSLIRLLLEEDHVKIVLSVPDDLPEIPCRSQQIQQVLMNLLTNARYALNSRYPDEDVEKVVRIEADGFEKDGEPWVRITVENHGEHIPEDLKIRMFDPFFTTKPLGEGTGLGLSVSHGIAKDHKGELTVESEEGGWTRFHLDLPINHELAEMRARPPIAH